MSKVELRNIQDGGYALKTQLINEFNKSEKKFFECDAFVAALLLDPRFEFTDNAPILNAALKDRGIVRNLQNLNFYVFNYLFSF